MNVRQFKSSIRNSLFLSAFVYCMSVTSVSYAQTDLASIPGAASTAAGFESVNTEISTYLSTRLPFMAGLGRNAYRAALPNATAPLPSFLISVGGGVGLMGGFDSVRNISSDVQSMGAGSMNRLPFIIGPSIYARIALPWLPVIGGLDIGVKYLQKLALTTSDLEYENGGFGVDIRYAILRDLPLIPLIHLSLAVGGSFDSLKGSFKTKGKIEGTGGVAIDGKYGPEWNITTTDIFLQATAKILIVSLTVGASVGMRGGDTTTTLDGIVTTPLGTYAMNPISNTVDASGTDFKYMVGLGISIFPFVTLYFEGNRNNTTGDAAGTGAINLTF